MNPLVGRIAAFILSTLFAIWSKQPGSNTIFKIQLFGGDQWVTAVVKFP